MADPSAPAAFSVLIADSISPAGVELLRSTPSMDVTVSTGMDASELAHVIGSHDGLIVRSASRVTAEALESADRLRVIGRAGSGVDNIDLDAATRAGVVVMNTPGGNSIAAAEHTFALMLSMARNVPQANHELLAGRWERKKYVGIELAGKVLGIVGLGRIGREVARRAAGFGMELLGYDPYVSPSAAADFGVRVVPLEDLAASSDIITLHLPVSAETRHLIDAKMLERIKRGARLVNCARGGLIDDEALLEALEANRIAGAALDVFETEPPTDGRLVAHPRVVATPHLGASTREAQDRVGKEIAGKVRDFLRTGAIRDAVNSFPTTP